jgi:hypothetical protein
VTHLDPASRTTAGDLDKAERLGQAPQPVAREPMEHARRAVLVPAAAEGPSGEARPVPGLDQPRSSRSGELGGVLERSTRVLEVGHDLDHRHEVEPRGGVVELERAGVHDVAQALVGELADSRVGLEAAPVPALGQKAFEHETRRGSHVEQDSRADVGAQEAGVARAALAEEVGLRQVVRVTGAAAEEVVVAIDPGDVVLCLQQRRVPMAASLTAEDLVPARGEDPAAGAAAHDARLHRRRSGIALLHGCRGLGRWGRRRSRPRHCSAGTPSGLGGLTLERGDGLARKGRYPGVGALDKRPGLAAA